MVTVLVVEQVAVVVTMTSIIDQSDVLDTILMTLLVSLTHTETMLDSAFQTKCKTTTPSYFTLHIKKLPITTSI